MEAKNQSRLWPSPAAALRAAVERIGSQAETAALIGISQQAVSKRLRDEKACWGKHVPKIALASSIPEEELRPDLYPPEPVPAAPPEPLGSMELSR